MADNKWTDEQLRAIELKDRRLLVSAAAGSGKTAVLVERIIRRITDPVDPVDVDRLLVMTFTKAAAAEMKERIRQRLSEALGETLGTVPSVPRLREQIALIDSASIQTIDSFCMNVVRDHTDELDIDPNVRVAEEAELTLLKADVMEDMLESYYEKADEAFIDFVEAYGQGTSGAGIEEKIYKLYGFAQVTQDPENWYQSQLDASNINAYTEYIFETMREMVSSMAPAIQRLLTICQDGEGPKGYVKTLESDLEFVEAVGSTQDYLEFSKVMLSYNWPAIGRKAKTDNDEMAEKISTTRNKQIKEKIKEWTADYCRERIEEIEAEEERIRPYVNMLVELARDFDHRLAAAKKDKNLIDFNDLEHMALKVLVADDDYKLNFDEIYVDEYQDTNDIQNAIIDALDRGKVFMVGDVKQSIYKFRQAKPEIFMDKYQRFSDYDETEAGKDTVIELAKNFRSRSQVLEDTNNLFRRIMVKNLGGVEYTDKVALYPGADYPDPSHCPNYNTELLLVDTATIEADDSKIQAEARVIASKIREIVDPQNGMKVWDRKAGKYRPARYADIVILLRSSNTVGDTYLNALLDTGIQAHCETNKGYFDSPEVRTIIALLTAIDNPRKEISMAAFLKSPIIGLSDDELVIYRKSPVILSEGATAKVDKAMQLLADYRSRSKYMSMEELITCIYDETGYYEYAAALPGGKVRKANLDKLKRMAAEYASTGYSGLFNFIRYIENLKTYDTDFGEASSIGEHDDTVRIMSIHKSKGLEFPIVFLANSDKKVNQMDSNQAILMDSELGVGCVYINVKERYKEKTLKQMALRLKLRNDTLGEELRVLYVAMTRAGEKLYITGNVKDSETFIEQYNTATHLATADPLELSKLRSDAGYLYWITESGVGYPYTLLESGNDGEIRTVIDEAQIKTYLEGVTADDSHIAAYDDIFGFKYPYEIDVDLANKVSISELKHRWMEEEGEILTQNYTIFKNDGATGGAERGTIYHEVMEKLDHSAPDLENLPDCVKKSDIEAFTNSDLGQLFKKAQEEKRLYRERQFIMGVPARELKLGDSEEPVLVQGIIDAFIENEDGMILVDYKTDRVDNEEELVKRYAGQLYYYAMALSKMRNKPVTRKVIWSFALGKAIDL